MAKYDDFIKRPLQEHDYTVKEIKELQKCTTDIWAFLKYVKIVHPDHGRVFFKPRAFQKEILQLLATERQIVALIARQTGKCVCPETSVRVRQKSTGKESDVTIGELFDKYKK